MKMKEKLYSNKNLLYLFIPLVIEQGLEYLVGFADSLMVAKVGGTDESSRQNPLH